MHCAALHSHVTGAYCLFISVCVFAGECWLSYDYALEFLEAMDGLVNVAETGEREHTLRANAPAIEALTAEVQKRMMGCASALQWADAIC